MAKMQNNQGNNQNAIENIQEQLAQTRTALRKQIAEEYRNQQSFQEVEQSSRRKR